VPSGAALTDWILTRRPARNPVAPDRPYAFLVEAEPGADGQLANVATIFLTNRECPFRCLMCDLWKNTLPTRIAPGMIPAQIRWALAQLSAASQVKLYNAGNFFDPQAIPPEDYADIIDLARPFERLIVECHPRLLGRRFQEFHRLFVTQCGGNGTLEVAMGLETVHPEVLRQLNKQMTLADFARAVHLLRENDVAVRAFILVRPPYMTDAEGLSWAKRSLDYAFSLGVQCCSLIPTRAGNGAMDELAQAGLFAPPSLDALEAALEHGLALKAGRVFLDLWDIERVTPEAPDSAPRIARLQRMNLTQRIEPSVGMLP
jgi:radical SAM enzyme (TIGR01210 family)